jgi:hypothetical protein
LADSFTFPQKEDVLRIFIAFETLTLSVGIEPVNLGSSGKHDNVYTTEDDGRKVINEEHLLKLHAHLFKMLRTYYLLQTG